MPKVFKSFQLQNEKLNILTSDSLYFLVSIIFFFFSSINKMKLQSKVVKETVHFVIIKLGFLFVLRV